MSAAGRRDGVLAGAGLLLAVLCCALGPAVLGAIAGAAIGGRLGIACAALVAFAAGLFLLRRTRAERC